jgi:hypothetical protein
MILELEDGFSLGKNGKGKEKFKKIAKVGRRFLMPGVPMPSDLKKLKKKSGSAGNRPAMAKALRVKKKPVCKCPKYVAPGKGKKVIYNKRSGMAYIVPLNDAGDLVKGAAGLVGKAAGATPYGAAIKTGLSVVSGIFGKKKSSSKSSGGAGASAGKAGSAGSAVDPTSQIVKPYVDMINKFAANSKNATEKIKKLSTDVSLYKGRINSLGKLSIVNKDKAAEMEKRAVKAENERYFYAGGGLIAGVMLGKIL